MPFSTPSEKIPPPPFPHEKEVQLASYSTFKIGGAAQFFSTATSKKDLQEMLKFCHSVGLPFFILGKGSNTLFDDRGFKGLVILNRLDYLTQEGALFTVGAGYSFARLGVQTAGRGFSGLEFAAGIPATCGGAIFMNAGAGGQDVSSALESVTYINSSGEERVYQKEELEFRYRYSTFQKLKGAIVEGSFSLLASEGAKKKQQSALDYRLKTQPYKSPSIGCIFRNPHAASAGGLIESCGLKGLKKGGAEVSSKHANFVINAGEAKAAEVLELIQMVKKRVFEEKGILLEEEIRYLPYE